VGRRRLNPADITAEVLAWGAPRLRDLPWRRTRDPWAVLVSEVMLQQTQSARVVPKWLAFLERFPTPSACAAAPLGEVLVLWQGLGYPRRARNLQAAAVEIERLGGFPEDLDGLLALPGIGPYTARAVLAFAFERDVAVVDTNIARVWARLDGRRLSPTEVQHMADAAVPSGDAWLWNQALMDLGATLCRPRAPSCHQCPVRHRCAWHGEGDDPSKGSAGVSRPQARFAGSDREARGRLLRAAGRGPLAALDAATLIGRSPADADRLAADLVREGLLRRDGPWLTLP
jgi:A/G-specific adenine glycosylase